MGSLTEFVEVWAPGLLGAVPGRPGADPAKIDAEVAHLLAAVWLAGPPFGDTLARSRRRLAAGYAGGSADLVDLGAAGASSPGAVTVGDEPVTPDRVARVLAAVERTVERRARHTGLGRVAQGLVAAALAVVVGLGGLQLLQANEAQRAGAPPATSSTVAAPTAAPAAQPTACPYSVCRWETVQNWTIQVKEAVHATVDPTSAVFGSTDPRPMVTTVVEVPRGRYLEAGFGSVVPGSSATFALTIQVTTRRDLLPVCGTDTTGRCTTTRTGVAVTTSRSAHAVEVFHRTADGTWVHVLAESPQRPPFALPALTRLAMDPRLAFPS